MNTVLKCSEEVLRKRMRARVAKLVVECPVSRSNPTMCPLSFVREKPMAARVSWVDALRDDDIEFLSGYHKVCQKWQKAGCP